MNEPSICLDCLRSGVEAPRLPAHKRGHAYRVMDNHRALSVHTPDWTVDEEIALLDAIEIYGLGNWRDAAHFVGGGRSDAACAKHYQKVYLDGKAASPLAGGEFLVASPRIIEGQSGMVVEEEAVDLLAG